MCVGAHVCADVYGWERGAGVCVCVSVFCISLHILVSSLCKDPHRGSVYIEIGGLPKQRVSYSKARDMQTGSDNLSIMHTRVMDP